MRRLGNWACLLYVTNPTAPLAEEHAAPRSVRFDAPEDLDAMTRVERLALLVARSHVSAILTGETGVGKDVLAERIHRLSTRREGPFIPVNCAAIAEQLTESELFGHERGAFTGAFAAKIGLLEAANGGTVFLDEIGDLPLPLQAKFLRAIEKKEVLPVGASRPRPFDARFIAATHRNLETLVLEGSFRADLFYRLNGITIEIPPLRQRRDEIEPLGRLFVREAARSMASAEPVIASEVWQKLAGYEFPGNVRELKNLLERAVVVCTRGELRAGHIDIRQAPPSTPSTPSTPPTHSPRPTPSMPEPLAAKPPSRRPSLSEEMEEFERGRIEAALVQTNGNQTKAAKLLGVTRWRVVSRMEQWGLGRPRKS